MSLILSNTLVVGKKKYMDLARKLSYKSTHPKHKLGATIIKGSKILGLGFNKLRTDPLSPTPFHQIHAELDALNDKDTKDFRGSKIYVYRKLQNGEQALAKPCIYCQKELKRRGVKECIYTEDKDSVGQIFL